MIAIKTVYNNETRRFSIQKEAPKTKQFQHLIKTTHKLFHIPHGTCFLFQYQDSEGDSVLLSSAEELTEAILISQPHDLLSLKVILRSPSGLQEKENNQEALDLSPDQHPAVLVSEKPKKKPHWCRRRTSLPVQQSPLISSIPVEVKEEEPNQKEEDQAQKQEIKNLLQQIKIIHQEVAEKKKSFQQLFSQKPTKKISSLSDEERQQTGEIRKEIREKKNQLQTLRSQLQSIRLQKNQHSVPLIEEKKREETPSSPRDGHSNRSLRGKKASLRSNEENKEAATTYLPSTLVSRSWTLTKQEGQDWPEEMFLVQACKKENHRAVRSPDRINIQSTKGETTINPSVLLNVPEKQGNYRVVFRLESAEGTKLGPRFITHLSSSGIKQ